MEVNCEFLDAHTTDSTRKIADRSTHMGAGNFRSEIEEHLLAGHAILLDDDMEMLVIGGRASICQASATNPVASYVFCAPPGKMIYASRAASSRKRWAVGMGAARMGQIISGPPAGVLDQATKTRTVLHLFSESADFQGHAIGCRLNGADVSLHLSKLFV